MIKSKLITTAASLTLISASMLSVEGFARGEKGSRHGDSEESRLTLLERLDSNADGILTLDEFADRNAQSDRRHFNKKDSDDNAQLSFEEFSSVGKHRRRPKAEDFDAESIDACVAETLGYQVHQRPDVASAFADIDTNTDGAIDLEEFLAAGDLRAEQRFAEIDVDGDAQLTDEEITQYEVILGEQRRAHRTCVREQLEEDSLFEQV